jgi:multiple antibiotic resistance protein
MAEVANVFLLVYAGLFPIINPFGGAPIFLSATAGRSTAQRNALARGVAVNSFLLLVGSMFVGSHVLEFFGITLPVVRVAGGLVVSVFAWKLLQSGADLDGPRLAAPERPHSDDESFYPLTMPLTVGPGSISVAIALGSQRPLQTQEWVQLALLGGAALAALLAIAATIYVCYRFADRVIARLGSRGTNVVVRLSAFILLCIGIQILWTGYSALMGTLR